MQLHYIVTEVVVSVAAVTLLGCFVAVDPHTEELSTILAASLPPAPSPLLHEPYSRSWVLSLCMEYLEVRFALRFYKYFIKNKYYRLEFILDNKCS